jgi:CheY-like chemotaxis protein
VVGSRESGTNKDRAVKYRVLVVDDYPDVANVVCTLMKLLGHDCRAATDGASAIEIVKTWELDIALVDIGLPDISGLELARIFREIVGARPVYLAAISGWGEPSDRVQAIAAGFDHHVLKPIDAGIAKRIVQLAEARLPCREAAPNE